MEPCERCGKILEVGDWPFCPHGRGYSNVIPDEYASPQVLENVAHEPVTVHSRSERRRVLRAHGLQEFVRHVGVDGTDKSPHTSNWATASPETLAAGAALVAGERRSHTTTPGKVDSPTVKYTFDIREY
jgi:hypothetical protein